MSGTSAEFTLTLPISEQAFWTIALLFGLVVLSALIAWGLPKSKGGALSPIDTICERLGLSHGFGPLVLLAVCVAMALGAAGLFTLVDFMKAALHMPPYHQVNDGAAIRNIGLVLAALLGAPFVIWRSYVAAKQARIQDEALFNDKIKVAAEGLAARHQVTRVVHQGTTKEVVLTEWVDDVVTRAAAIDQLEGLANERPSVTPRVARLLSIYVRELSREFPAEQSPAGLSHEQTRVWISNLDVKRRDSEKAAQTLGRLQKISGNRLVPSDLDMRQTNLQAFDLSECLFNGFDFSGSNLQNAKLISSNLDYANVRSSDLFGADFTGASLISLKATRAVLSGANFEHVSMNNAVFYNAILVAANFYECSLSGANFSGSILDRAVFCDSDLADADFNRAKLRQSEFLNTKLPHANFRHAHLQGSIFENSEFHNTEFGLAWIQGADFYGTGIQRNDRERARFENGTFFPSSFR